ncbi:glycosyltransferase [Polaribacter sargassicola]|uniref:glycosyltransferase n=1 Tax=Polaribacter sargassicola TaxID=2836891 RepID=UPI001F3EEA7C|nr:glycosyltransferase [Polaribacter sp. DS7-9]MCG1036613.1 glycosyltransferase [Polaribacter sp. DS7-9]
MKFGIITHAIHKIKDGHVYAYEPYVREMNLWGKYVDEIIIIAPVAKEEITSIESAYQHLNIKVMAIPNFDITSVKNLFKALLVIPKICWMIFTVMKNVDHIHLRCPGNIGLLGCLVQILFPSKQKTAKYAGNWDPKSKQPVTYKFQKWLLANTFLTKKIKVLVYGDWPNQSKNILPFFTASYHQTEIVEVPNKDLKEPIKLIFVGGLTIGKQPLLSVQSAHQLIKKGYNISLDIYGDGVKRLEIENYIASHQLKKHITLHGNVDKEIVKKAFQQSHFLIFISKSEGWPKVVAEAMFWSCLPISSNVSCIDYMLADNQRGSILKHNVKIEDIVIEIESYLRNKEIYKDKVLKAQNWSQKYTLDKFEKEIQKLVDV